MAAVAEISADAAAANKLDSNPTKQESEFNVQKLVDMFTKLNPLAKEFFPSYYYDNRHLNQFSPKSFLVSDKSSANDNYPNNLRVCLFILISHFVVVVVVFFFLVEFYVFFLCFC